MRIPFFDLKRSYSIYSDEILQAIEEVIERGDFIHGENCHEFEREFAEYLEANYCIGVGNGLDAIRIILKSWIELGLLAAGDEVLVPSNSFIASALPVQEMGLKIKFVEPDQGTHLVDRQSIENSISQKTKVIMPVHLYGQIAPMDEISEIAKDLGLMVLEDAAQAHGASRNGKSPGTFGDAGAFSFYPAKNMGAFGDGGCITTSNNEQWKVMKSIANYGASEKYVHERVGLNSRLDEIQAAILRIRLKNLDRETDERNSIAENYFQGISNSSLRLPDLISGGVHAWHLFVIRTDRKDKIIEEFTKNGIGYGEHYPYRLPDQPCFSGIDLPPKTQNLISIPIYPGLTISEQEEIIHILNGIN